MSLISVIITSVGGNVGQGIVKALRVAKKSFRIIGIDMEPLSAGFSLVDKYYTVPRAGADGFIEKLKYIQESENAQAIYVCSHAELVFFSSQKKKLEEILNIPIFVNPSGVIGIGCDKLKTADFLKEAGLPYPDTALAIDEDKVKEIIEKHGFPLILKPRKGASSKNVFLVDSFEQIEAAKVLIPDLIVQQYLPNDKAEYTAGSISDEQKKVRATIILHRDLLQGTTYRTELTQDEAIEKQVIQIVEKLGAVGPCNIQFRLLDGIVYVFEINPRFSGTSGIRYLYNFNDAEITFDLLQRKESLVQPKLKPGVVLRYWDEVYIPDASFEDLRNEKKRHCGAQPFRGRSIK